MTTRTPLVVVNGHTQQMPTGDAVPLTHGGTGATTAGDALTALGAVPSTRALTMTAPLTITGGGDLSADRTLGLSYDTTLQVVGGALGVSSLVALTAHTHSQYVTSAGSVAYATNAGNGVPHVSCAAVLGAYQYVAMSTWTKLAINTEEYDNGGYYDTTLYRFAPLVAGKYLCIATANIGTIFTNGRAILSCYKNGSEYRRYTDSVIFGASGNLSGSVVVALNGTTDYIELYTYQVIDTTVVYAQSSYTSFSATWIGQ